MQRILDIYPEYAGDVDFYAVGVFPIEDIEIYERFRIEKGYPWPVAIPKDSLLPDLQVTIQSTKIAFNSEGVIIHRAGMGQGNPEVWHQVFSVLASS